MRDRLLIASIPHLIIIGVRKKGDLSAYLVMFLKSDGFMPVWVLNLEEK